MERGAGIAGGAAVSGFAVVGVDVAVDDAKSEEGEQELAMMARAMPPVAKTRVAPIMIHATRTAAGLLQLRVTLPHARPEECLRICGEEYRRRLWDGCPVLGGAGLV
jgi:hypothetical protein